MSIHKILKTYWGFDTFRAGQEQIIHSVMDGHDTLAIMPTSGGKSLCYQLPAMARDGICLVISPLIALMKDQVQRLRQMNITAYAIYGSMTRKEVIHTLRTVVESNCKFLYVSPERLETALFREYLPGMNINLIAVDEAHCVSQWGYDFRPPYLRIAALRDEVQNIPVLALTASATREIQDDICEKLSVRDVQEAPEHHKGKWKVIRQSFERPNLSYSVFRVDSKVNKVFEILSKVNGSGIIYCRSRKRTKEISELLKMQGIAADYYHAGMNQEERNRKQEEWISNKVRVIVCTNAFGMGIDKPDVRSVIHIDVPDCLESYYQEAGRAGRDGKTSFAILLFDDRDLTDLQAATDSRFPPETEIRNMYQALSNYLQIPAGSGEGQYYNFDLPDFVKKFKLHTSTTLYALKVMEQEGWLSFNEQVFLPSTVEFTTEKTQLEAFEKMFPAHITLIRTLLRAYEGIFTHPVFISEKVLAGITNTDVDEIKKDLTTLDRHRIIHYQPQKDRPQLLLLRPRMRTEELHLNKAAYYQRKEKYSRRLEEMVRYMREEKTCRSRIIGRYFGDDYIKSCGICDNCFRVKKIDLTKEEFELINHRILNTIKYESLHAKELLGKLTGIQKEKAWKVIEFLQAENKIHLDERGLLRIK